MLPCFIRKATIDISENTQNTGEIDQTMAVLVGVQTPSALTTTAATLTVLASAEEGGTKLALEPALSLSSLAVDKIMTFTAAQLEQLRGCKYIILQTGSAQVADRELLLIMEQRSGF